jgi:hypothetical protein
MFHEKQSFVHGMLNLQISRLFRCISNDNDHGRQVIVMLRVYKCALKMKQTSKNDIRPKHREQHLSYAIHVF